MCCVWCVCCVCCVLCVVCGVWWVLLPLKSSSLSWLVFVVVVVVFSSSSFFRRCRFFGSVFFVCPPVRFFGYPSVHLYECECAPAQLFWNWQYCDEASEFTLLHAIDVHVCRQIVGARWIISRDPLVHKKQRERRNTAVCAQRRIFRRNCASLQRS